MTAQLKDMGKNRRQQLALALVHLEKLEAAMKVNGCTADAIRQVTDRKHEVNMYRGRATITEEMLANAAEWSAWWTTSPYCR